MYAKRLIDESDLPEPRRTCRIRLLLAVLTLSLTLAAPAWAARPVDCGDSFSGDGKLRGSCFGNVVMTGGRLDLAGHTLQGSVICSAELCEIYSRAGGGTVAGGGLVGTVGVVAGAGAAEGAGSLVLDNVIVTGFATGVAASNVQVTDSLIGGNRGHGVDALVAIEAVGSIVSFNGSNGLHSRLGSVSAIDCDISENRMSGIRALEGVILTGSVVDGNGRDGVENYSARALVVDSTVSSNGRHGVRSDDADCVPTDELHVVASEVLGNGLSADCGVTTACADLVSCAAPTLRKGASCASSYRMMSGLPGVSWGSCSGD